MGGVRERWVDAEWAMNDRGESRPQAGVASCLYRKPPEGSTVSAMFHVKQAGRTVTG